MTLPYSSLDTHRWLLRDGPRLEAFNQALKEVIQPGMVVLDVGAGSGVLSFLAARAGASRVYAVESTPVARLARQLAAHNHIDTIVHVVESDLQNVNLPEKVDLIVSEWLGTIGVDENLLYPVLIARDRWLKPDGVMMPKKVSALLAPAQLATRVEINHLHAPAADSPLHLLNLAPLSEHTFHDLLCRRYQIRPDDLAAVPQIIWVTNCQTDSLDTARCALHAELSFRFSEPRQINALVAWFAAELSPGRILSNSPDLPETHWGQLTLPLNTIRDVPAGGRLDVRIACIPRVPGVSDLNWAVRLDEGSWEIHDTRMVPPNPPQPSVVAQYVPCSVPMNPAPCQPTPVLPAVPAQVQLPSPEQAAPLTQFLARLSVDTEILYRLICDPQAVFELEGLSSDDISALTSRDAGQIVMAMMKETVA